MKVLIVINQAVKWGNQGKMNWNVDPHEKRKKTTHKRINLLPYEPKHQIDWERNKNSCDSYINRDIINDQSVLVSFFVSSAVSDTKQK